MPGPGGRTWPGWPGAACRRTSRRNWWAPLAPRPRPGPQPHPACRSAPAAGVRMLLAHHERRCEEVIAILDRLGPATVWQVTEELTWSRGWSSVIGFMRRAALAEAGAHLRHLADLGRVGMTAAEDSGPDLDALVTSAPE